VIRAGAALLGLLMAGGAVTASYHAGVEWHGWPGPDTCTGDLVAAPSSVAELLAQLQNKPVVPCDEAAWVFLGLSMAGWNALLSTGKEDGEVLVDAAGGRVVEGEST
jgi:disulfide bond formation protein DsbB